MTEPLLLGVDMGSSRTKALLLDGDGTEVASAALATPFVTTGARTEAPAAALLDVLRQVLDRLGDHRRRVVAVGIAGMAECGAPLDHGGRPLAPVVAWHDRRGQEVADRVAARIGPDLERRIGQRMRYVSSAAKLGWLLDNGVPGVVAWLGVPELVLLALTGERATEVSLAVRTACMDVATGAWLPDVANAAGFDVAVFADVLIAGCPMGQVTAGGAAWSGVPAGVPVTIAGHDHLAGVVGSGATAGDLANSVGTAETVVGRSAGLPDVAAAVASGAAVTIFPGGNGWATLASAARAGLAVDYVAAALGRTPAELDAAAGDAVALGAPLLDAPDLLESLRRRDPPALPSPGSDDHHDRGQAWATLLDALARCTAEAVATVTAAVGPKARLVVFGGGANSRPWLAAKAHHVPLPVLRSATRHAVARGAAVQAGVAAGWWSSPAEAPSPDVAPAVEPGRSRSPTGG